MDHFNEEKEATKSEMATPEMPADVEQLVKENHPAETSHTEIEASSATGVEAQRFVQLRGWQLTLSALLLIALSVVTTLVFTSRKDIGDNVTKPTVNINADIARVQDVYSLLFNRYYKEVDTKKLVNGAITGMVNALDDPFSSYLVGNESTELNEMIMGEFSGIGATIGEKDGLIFIESPMKGLPAEKAGLKIGDVILSVDGVSMNGKKSTEAVKLIRGKKGTKVTLEIKRPGKEGAFKVTITRDTIPLNSVEAEMLDGKIAHININSFSTNTGGEMKKKLAEMEADGMKGLVLDLRSNPGGVMEAAIDVANYFVPEGEIIMEREPRTGEKEISLADANGGYKVKVPVVVLMNEDSASASEIVAAALHDSAGAKVIGTKSYGKGTVQMTMPTSDGSVLKLTVSKWLTPKGEWIHEKGITPDEVVEMPSYASLLYMNPKEPLTKGNYSTEIANAEKVVAALGYDPGKTEGYFDNKTELAVKAFQKANQLAESGEIDSSTAAKMMELLRKKLEQNDSQLNAAVKKLSK